MSTNRGSGECRRKEIKYSTKDKLSLLHCTSSSCTTTGLSRVKSERNWRTIQYRRLASCEGMGLAPWIPSLEVVSPTDDSPSECPCELA